MTGRELFQIGLYHTYYQRGVSQQLALIPDTDTSAFFKRYGLLFHCVDSIHTVSYFGSNSIDSALSKLSFWDGQNGENLALSHFFEEKRQVKIVDGHNCR